MSACCNHICGKRKLLTVEYKEVSIFLEPLLASLTFIKELVNSVILLSIKLIDHFDSSFLKDSYLIIILLLCLSTFFDIIPKLICLYLNVNYSLSQALKSDHKLSFSFKLGFIIILIPDDIPYVEVFNASFEVTFWRCVMILCCRRINQRNGWWNIRSIVSLLLRRRARIWIWWRIIRQLRRWAVSISEVLFNEAKIIVVMRVEFFRLCNSSESCGNNRSEFH